MTEPKNEIPSAFIARTVERTWPKLWEDAQLFQANPLSDKPPFCVMMPPPNVTGILHMGHTLCTTLQDILVRWKKMSGFEVLWLPGTDHAGISTQTVVERHLLKTLGKRRTDFKREDFLHHVWEWKEQSQSTILGQISAIGCSCDWSRLRFSMDEQCNKAVRHMFKKLFDQGLIYRGNYLVNWDPVTETALADDEVEYEDRVGSLWTIRYPVCGEDFSIFVATTRPETMLGDTAVAVHPKDQRYHHLIGKYVELPLSGRHIPIIADELIDPEFGTGAVKVTPAHDPNDYQLGMRHNLPMISIFTKKGIVNEEGGRFQGLTIEEARKQVVEALKNEGYLSRVDPHQNRVGVSYRSKAVIEPMLSLQWFVRLSAFKEPLRSYVENKEVKIVPQAWEHTYYQWIDNLRDWCISRQLWWGHRIPVWYKKQDPTTIVCYEGEGEPEEVARNPDDWIQDPDVLDTWFSSALWPFSTLGWPNKTPELKKFYPNSTLVTGHDILFFWVARMIMMGHVAMGKPPFHETFLHGLIYGKSYWRDQPGIGVAYVSQEERKAYDLLQTPVPADVKSKWEKMSKSKGNVLDPMEIIADYGTDAMRLALSASTTDASIIELDRRRFEEFRHFVNKLWNGARFVIMKLEENPLQPEFLCAWHPNQLALEDSWIMSRLSKTITAVNSSLSRYAFDKATYALYNFFWNEFCALYIEIAKPHFATQPIKRIVSLVVLIDVLKLLHPFAPYVTEEIFSILRDRFHTFASTHGTHPQIEEALLSLSQPFVSLNAFPKAFYENDVDEETFTRIQAVVSSLRAIRGEMKIPPSVAVDLYVAGKGNKDIQLAEQLLRSLVKLATISYVDTPPKCALSSRAAVTTDCELIVPLPESMKEQEKQRVTKSIERIQKTLEKLVLQHTQASSNERTPLEVLEKIARSIEQQKKELLVLNEQLLFLS